MNFNKNRMGLALGSISALFHLLWIIAVAAGSGKILADWLHNMHFIADIHIINEFTIATAFVGVLLAFISGYISGYIFSAFWNFFGKK